MSALPPIADIGEGIAECPLMTQSGHCFSPSRIIEVAGQDRCVLWAPEYACSSKKAVGQVFDRQVRPIENDCARHCT